MRQDSSPTTVLDIRETTERIKQELLRSSIAPNHRTIDMRMTPKVSVIIPVYTHENDGGEAIADSPSHSFTARELFLRETPWIPRNDGSSSASVSLLAIELRGIR